MSPAPPPRTTRLRSHVAGACLVLVCCIAQPVSAAPTAALGNGLRLIEHNYLFSDELNADRLLGEALEYLEARIPEVVAHAGDDGGYVLSAGDCVLFLEVPPAARLIDLESPLRHAGALVERCVRHPPDPLPPTESLLLSGVLSGLDPYSAVFDAERKTEHTIQFRGTLAGVGARIGIRDDHLTLITVYPGSPAYQAGLRDHDVVTRIDGMSTTNLAVGDAVQRIRGAVGTQVVLTIEREGRDTPKSYTVTRDLVTIPSVTTKRLGNGVIYAEISHFSQTTPTDFQTRVSELTAEDIEPKGIVIDLRRNSGGSMLGSSSIGDLFLDDALLITTAGRGGHSVSGLTAEIRATEPTPFRAYPVAILTSPRTASGSELLAASLRNNDRAIILGERSFGKGTVQKTYALGSDSSLKLTVGNFLPNGLAIPGGGMIPDVEVRRFRFGTDKVSLPSTKIADDMPFWLTKPTWLTSEPDRDPVVLTFVEKIPDADADNEEEEDMAAQPIVALAAEVLERYGDVSAARTLMDARVLLYRHAREADREVARVLKDKGVDWHLPAGADTGKNASTRVRVEALQGDGVLHAGKTERIDFAVTNDGDHALYRAYATVSSKTGYLRGQGLLLGLLEPGSTRTWSIEVEVPTTARFARADAVLDLYDANGFVASSAPLLLAVEPAAQPRLAYRLAVSRDHQNNARYAVRIEVENRGSTPTGEVKALLRHPDSDEIELLEGTATIDTLAPGQTAHLDLSVRALTSFEKAPELDLVLSEADYHLFVETKAKLDPAAGNSGWREPPTVNLERLVATEAGLHLVARVSDDSGIASVWGTFDGEKSGYVEFGAEQPSTVRIDLPWIDGNKIKPVAIYATDGDGLRSRLDTEL